MVTCCFTKMITCLPMIGYFFDTVIVTSTDRIITHQNLSLRKVLETVLRHLNETPKFEYDLFRSLWKIIFFVAS